MTAKPTLLLLTVLALGCGPTREQPPSQRPVLDHWQDLQPGWGYAAKRRVIQTSGDVVDRIDMNFGECHVSLERDDDNPGRWFAYYSVDGGRFVEAESLSEALAIQLEPTANALEEAARRMRCNLEVNGTEPEATRCQ